MAKRSVTVNYPLIDIIKFVFAIMIVLMHADFLDQTIVVEYRIQITVFALIVPFFFVASGFFIGVKFGDDVEENNKIITTSLKRYVRLFAIFGGWYFVINILKSIIIDHDLIKNLPHIIHQLLVETPGGGIWYVYTLIWCVVILYFCNKASSFDKNIKITLVVFFILFLFGAFFFARPLKETPVRELYDRVLLTDRNVLFYGIYFFSGFMVSRCCFKRNAMRVIFLISVVVFFIIYGLLFYDWNSIPESIVFAILKLLAVLAIFLLGLQLDSANLHTKQVRQMSTVIYFTHWNFIYFVVFAKNHFAFNHRILAVVCAALSVCFAYAILKIWKGKVYKMLFVG